MGELTVLIKLLKETPLQTILIVAGIIFLFLAIFSGLSKRISVSIFRQKLAGALGGTFLALGMLIYFVPGIKPGGQAMTTANTTEMPTNNNTIKTPATNSNYNLSKSHSTTSNNTISSTTENNWPKLSEKIREKETTKNSLDQWPLLANFNFTIENSQRWFVGTKTHGIGDRTQSFHDGRYRWDMEFEKRGYFWYRAPVPSVQDFSYSIDARLTDSPAYKSSYGMAFRISGKKFYAFLLADNRQFTISLFDSGDMKTLQPWTKQTRFILGPSIVYTSLPRADCSIFTSTTNTLPNWCITN